MPENCHTGFFSWFWLHLIRVHAMYSAPTYSLLNHENVKYL